MKPGLVSYKIKLVLNALLAFLGSTGEHLCAVTPPPSSSIRFSSDLSYNNTVFLLSLLPAGDGDTTSSGRDPRTLLAFPSCAFF